jgi:hypothetical protein
MPLPGRNRSPEHEHNIWISRVEKPQITACHTHRIKGLLLTNNTSLLPTYIHAQAALTRALEQPPSALQLPALICIDCILRISPSQTLARTTAY